VSLYRSSVVLWFLFALTPSIADAQIGGGMGSGGTGLRGPGSLRSGVGSRSSPIARPAPSLTPHQVFNPRGSLSTGQVLNPSPSLFRPSSGDALSPRSASRPWLHGTRDDSARLHMMSRSDLSRALDDSARGLANELQKLETSDDSNDQLRLDELRELAATLERNPDADVKPQLQVIRGRLDQISQTESQTSVSRLPSFQTLQLIVSELDMTAREREWAALLQLNAQLQGAIERFHHADQWQTYLDIAVSNADARMGQRPSSADLRVIQSRFDSVAQIEKYKPLTSMAIFKQTRVQLARYVSQLGDDSEG
jgi:hypothetical protein